MGSLLGRGSKNTSKAALGRTPDYANGAYQDVEVNTYKLKK